MEDKPKVVNVETHNQTGGVTADKVNIDQPEKKDKKEVKLTKQELTNLINIAGQVSVPIASKEAEMLRGLINKMSAMADQIK